MRGRSPVRRGMFSADAAYALGLTVFMVVILALVSRQLVIMRAEATATRRALELAQVELTRLRAEGIAALAAAEADSPRRISEALDVSVAFEPGTDPWDGFARVTVTGRANAAGGRRVSVSLHGYLPGESP